MSEQGIDRALVWDRAVRAFKHAVNPDWDGFNLRPDPGDPARFIAEGDLLRYEITVNGKSARLQVILKHNNRPILDRVIPVA